MEQRVLPEKGVQRRNLWSHLSVLPSQTGLARGEAPPSMQDVIVCSLLVLRVRGPVPTNKPSHGCRMSSQPPIEEPADEDGGDDDWPVCGSDSEDDELVEEEE